MVFLQLTTNTEMDINSNLLSLQWEDLIGIKGTRSCHPRPVDCSRNSNNQLLKCFSIRLNTRLIVSSSMQYAILTWCSPDGLKALPGVTGTLTLFSKSTANYFEFVWPTIIFGKT